MTILIASVTQITDFMNRCRDESGDCSKSSLIIMMAYIYSPEKQRSDDSAWAMQKVKTSNSWFRLNLTEKYPIFDENIHSKTMEVVVLLSMSHQLLVGDRHVDVLQ